MNAIDGLDDVTQYDILPYRTTLHDGHRCFICNPRIQLVTTLLTYAESYRFLLRQGWRGSKQRRIARIGSHVRPSAIKREYCGMSWE